MIQHSRPAPEGAEEFLANNTLIIGGSPRSGTTLMNQLLSSCADIPNNESGAEAKFLDHYLHAYRQGKASYLSDHKYFFGDIREFIELNQKILYSVLSAVFTNLNSNKLLLKWPLATSYFSELLELLPSIKIILMVRDPRDIIASLLQVGYRMEANGKENLFRRIQFDEVITFFHECYLPLYPLLTNPILKANFHIVKYENLVSNPLCELEKIMNFTGLNIIQGQKKDTSYSFNTSLWKEYKSEWLTELSGKSISTSSIGSHKNMLTKREKNRIENQTKNFFHIFNY